MRADQHWLCVDGDTLVASADFLGGEDWSRRAAAIVTAARNGGSLLVRLHEISKLARLLRLEFAHDLSREEAGRFSTLHPEDLRAEEAMHCAEAVSRGARALEALRLAGIVVCEEREAE